MAKPVPKLTPVERVCLYAGYRITKGRTDVPFTTKEIAAELQRAGIPTDPTHGDADAYQKLVLDEVAAWRKANAS